MSGFELVAGVIGIFFITGIVMGVLLVTAFPRLRHRNDRGYQGSGIGQGPPSSREDDEKPPRWPGE